MATPKRNMQKRPAPTVVKKDQSEQPRIAWHKLDIMTTIEIAEDQDEQGEAHILAQALQNKIATPEMVERLLEIREPANQREKIKRQMELYARYVEWLPRDWFVEGTPEDVDYSDPETYKLMRSKRFAELYRILAFGNEQAEVASGN